MEAIPKSTQPLDYSTSVLDLCVRKSNFTKTITEEQDKNNNNSDNNRLINDYQTKIKTESERITHIDPKIEEISIGNQDPYTNLRFPIPKIINSPLCITSPCSDTSEISLSSVSSTASDLGESPRLKPLRPFKAYPRTALPLEGSLNAFQEFRDKFLTPLQQSRTTNKNMRRTSRTLERHSDDPQYLEKRRKNNEAAKRSRDARRMKEDEIAIRAAFLEREVIQLNQKLACREAKIEQLEMLLYRYTHPQS